MFKNLDIRITLLVSLMILSACGGSRVNTPSGPLSAGARNSIARENPEGLVRIGEGFERTGNLQNALDLYNQALAANPDLLSAKLARARLLAKTSHQEEGIAVLQALGTEYPDDKTVHIALTQALVFAEKYDDALQTIEPVAAREDADIQTLDLAGVLADINQLSMKAKTFYDRALEINPNDASVVRHLSVSFALDGEYESAIALLQGLLNIQTTQQIGKQTLANIYALSGQVEAANLIAKATFNSEQLRELDLTYRLLGTLEPEEKAVFLQLDVLPSSVRERIQKALAAS